MMADKLPGYIKKQLPMPGLPAPEPKSKLVPKDVQLNLRLNALESRLLRLELEVSLLRIQLENPKEDKDA